MNRGPDSSSCFLQSRQRPNRNEGFEDELNNLYNKKFQFRFDSKWELPGPDSWFSAPPWKIKQLETLKNRLNFHKSQLNDFNIEEWSSHTRRRNPAGEVCWKIRCLINPEFLTQAWTKFYECAYTYNIVPLEAIEDMKIVSLHLCEAPGAFITSLNHYLKLNHQGVNWQWVATTLNPYYEGNSPSNMISDDRFMFHTLQNWDFGVDSTGNLMNWDNSQSILKKSKSLGKVLLVTADGSIDCIQRPDDQEEVTSLLHYCEIVTALQALSKGGTLILKLFTMFEHSTVCLLYLINNLFGEVNIYKPATSRQGNSEVYAICLKFKGSNILQQYIPLLKLAYGTELYGTVSMFPLEAIPKDFLAQIEECANYFSSIQCQVINNNLQAYLLQKNIALHSDIKRIRSLVASQFIWHYDIKPLDYDQEILKGVLHEENKVNTNPRYHRGSHTERQLYTKMSLKEKAKNLNIYLQAEVLSDPMILINEPVRWITLEADTELPIVFTYGRPLLKVNSSKFVFVPIFKLYQQIVGEEEFEEILSILPSSDTQNDLNLEYNKKLLFPEFNFREKYNVYEKQCFSMLLNLVRDCGNGETLLLQNFNCLTHYNVSVLYILSKCFEKTGFCSNGSILLHKLIKNDNLKYLNVVEREILKVRNEMKDVLNCLPVQFTNVGEFYITVVYYNNTFYRNKCTQYLSAIERSL